MSDQIARSNMIKQQLRTGDVLDTNILQLFDDIPRDEFVPESYKELAFSDMQIPLLHGQKMLTPLEEAKILQALNLTGNEVVLEVGTGTGFLTALLSRLSKKVISVDYFPDFTTLARQNLARHNCNNVELYTGDASRGWMEKAPYDVIILTGAIEHISKALRLQLMAEGKLFAIVGKSPVMQGQLLTLDNDEQWQEQLIFETDLPPLIDKLKPKEFVF